MSDRPKGRESWLQPTPGCECSVCRRARECQENGAPDGREQAGRVQRDADIQGWRDHWSDSPKDSKGPGSGLRSNEASDRREREEQGVDWLPAAYRAILGTPPQSRYPDYNAAKVFLRKIDDAIEHGGWTRNEWKRLHRMREKWKARAEGNDPRYNEVGNKSGGVTPEQQARIRQKRLLAELADIVGRSSRGD